MEKSPKSSFSNTLPPPHAKILNIIVHLRLLTSHFRFSLCAFPSPGPGCARSLRFFGLGGASRKDDKSTFKDEARSLGHVERSQKHGSQS